MLDPRRITALNCLRRGKKTRVSRVPRHLMGRGRGTGSGAVRHGARRGAGIGIMSRQVRARVHAAITEAIMQLEGSCYPVTKILK